MISIVMAIWNRKEFLAETIESVLSQTYKDFEFIIVDDGSTDGAIELVESYAKNDKRIKLIKKEHTGCTDTTNVGLQEAKGEYICILGSDDIWMDTKLQRQVAISKDFPDYILHNNSVSIDENGELLRYARFPDTTPEGYKEVALNKASPWFVTSSWFIPKEVLDKVGLLKHIYNDYEWMMRAILLHDVKMKLISEFLTAHRTNPSSNTMKHVGIEEFKVMAKEIQTDIKKQLEDRK